MSRKSRPSPKQIKKRKRIIGVLTVAVVVLAVMLGVGMTQEQDPKTNQAPDASDKGTNQPAASTNTPAAQSVHCVTIDTARGQIVLELYPDLMPVTVANFDKLVQSGFYNGLKFHRVEDWVVQGGDPNGDGTGGPGWTIDLETNPQLKNVRGAVAMARATDPNSAGSQFYILKKDAPGLDGQYAVFGKVIQGMDVVDQIQQGDLMQTVAE